MLSFGPDCAEYPVPKGLLSQCPKWADSRQHTIELPGVDSDIGHTLVHYLYTGTYQTLKPRGVWWGIKTTEYKRSILVYCAARTYELSGLELLAKDKMRSLGEGISIYDLLDVVTKAWPKLPGNEVWFSDYLNNKVRAAFKADEALFTKAPFFDHIGKVTAFDKALVKTVVEIYTQKIAGMVS